MKQTILIFFTLMMSLYGYSQMNYSSKSGSLSSIKHSAKTTHASHIRAAKSKGRTYGHKSKSIRRSKGTAKRVNSYSSRRRSNSFGSSKTTPNAYGSYKPSIGGFAIPKKSSSKVTFGGH